VVLRHRHVGNEVDRSARTIAEHVKVRDTGAVILDKTEPLDPHQGRGTVRSRK
jgi:hypothetical protein